MQLPQCSTSTIARKEGSGFPTSMEAERKALGAADFLRQANYVIFSFFPGILSIAEESTSWPMVSWPTYMGGLRAFNLKLWAGYDMLDYFMDLGSTSSTRTTAHVGNGTTTARTSC